MNYFSRPVKPPYFKVGLFVYLALLLGSAQPARAAVISASAAIDWSTFKVTPINIGSGLPTVIWYNQTDSSQAAIYSPCDVCASDFASNWSTGTLATQSGPASIASASTSVSQLKSNASINGDPLVPDSLNSFPNIVFPSIFFPGSLSSRASELTVQGNGVLLFEANYRLAGDVSTTFPYPYATSTVTFSLGAHSGDGDYGSGYQSLGIGIFDRNQSLTQTGTLHMAVAVQDGWQGTFAANASTSISGAAVSTVPLPAAFWLFGSALAGVAALRRPYRPAKCKE